MASFSFASNVSSLLVQRMLARSSAAQSQSMERLSSGMRINRASDDAVGLAIADKLSNDKRLFGAAIRNVNDAISLLNIASDAQSNQSSILSRLAELAEQSANGVYTTQQRNALNAEYQKLLQEFGRIGSSTSFNGLNLLSGGRGQVGGNSIGLQVGISGANLSNLNVAISDSGTLSGQVAFDQLRTAGLRGSMSEQSLNDYYGGNVFYTSIVDQTGVSRQIAVAITRGMNGSTGQQEVSLQVYQRVSDTGGAGASTATDTVTSASDTWVRGGQVALAIDSAGKVLTTGLTSIGLSFANQSISGTTSLDLRALQFSGAIEGYRVMTKNFMTIVEDQLGVSGPVPEDDFFNDLGADSLDATEFIMAVEEEFQINILDPEVANVRTVGEFLAIVALKLNYNSQPGQGVIDFTGVESQSRARNALDVVRQRQAELSTSQGVMGASQSRLEASLSVLGASREAYAGAESRIRDLDVAQETARLVAAQTAQQAGAMILASANSQPALLLSLLR
ncbi:MAG: hypothetical protein J0M12_11920 [Deltaproteobacteria bacterium]|nr:hypothetical protein [Deltaproteobacteria bacterium]